MPSAVQIQQAVQNLYDDSAKLHQIVHGDADTVVTTEGGPVKSVANLQREFQLDSATAVAQTEESAEIAVAAANVATEKAEIATEKANEVTDISGVTLAAAASQGAYPSESAGLAATTGGQYFYALSGVAPNKRASFYLNDSGDAVEQTELITAGLLAAPTAGSVIAYVASYSGAAPRSITEKLSEWPALKDFAGVKGIGAANDDTVGIRAAFASGAKNIWAEGNFYLSEAVEIPSGVRLRGPGGQAARFFQSAPNTRVFVFDDESDIELDGLFLEGTLTSMGATTAAGSAGGEAVVARNSERIKITGCTFKNFGMPTRTGDCRAIHLFICDDVDVHGNLFLGPGKSQTGGDIDYSYYCRRVRITNNTSFTDFDSFLQGPSVGTTANDTIYHIIDGNMGFRDSASTARSGIMASYASIPAQALYANNILEGWPSNAVYISAATVGEGNTAGVQLINNLARYCSGQGNDGMAGIEAAFYLSGRAGTTAIGNKAEFTGYRPNGTARSDNTAPAFLVSGAARGINVSLNIIKGSLGPGVLLRNGLVQTQEIISVLGNTFLDNLGPPIRVEQTTPGAVMRDILITGNNGALGADVNGAEVALANGASPPQRLKFKNNNIDGVVGSTKSGFWTNAGTLPGWSVCDNEFADLFDMVRFTNASLPDKEIGLVCPVDRNTGRNCTNGIVAANIGTGQYALAFDNLFVNVTNPALPVGRMLLGTRTGPGTFDVWRATTPPDGTWATGQRVRFTAPVFGGRLGAFCRVAGSPGSWNEFEQMHATVTKAHTFGTIAPGGRATTTVNISGLVFGDRVHATIDIDSQGVDITARVHSAGVAEVAATLHPSFGAGVSLGAATITAFLVKR